MVRFLSALCMLLVSLPALARPVSRPHVEWAKNANIYEVNIRQFTSEGTITAFAKQLPRLKKMGVKVLWLMPVQPIRVKNRKATFGSYYSIRDYKAVNPEFGTIDAMKFWVRETGIDGFRCGVAMLMPEPFWAQARTELDAIKPMFMLAEAAEPGLHARAFDATYHWKLQELLVEIAQGKKTADDLRAFYERPDPAFAPDAWRMIFYQQSRHQFVAWPRWREIWRGVRSVCHAGRDAARHSTGLWRSGRNAR